MLRFSVLAVAIALLLRGRSAQAARHLSDLAPVAEITSDVALNDSLAFTPSILLPPKCFVDVLFSVETSVCIASVPLDEPGVQTATCGVDTTIPAAQLGSCPDAQATLNAHNAERARWGAPPLLWSEGLADFAQGVSDTCRFAHSNGPYGENLALGGGLTCLRALELWAAEQRSWTPGSGFSSATGHFTQVVWKSTTQVGCATRSCGQGNFVTCSYAPAGNVIGRFDTQVGQRGETPPCVAPEIPGEQLPVKPPVTPVTPSPGGDTPVPFPGPSVPATPTIPGVPPPCNPEMPGGYPDYPASPSMPGGGYPKYPDVLPGLPINPHLPGTPSSPGEGDNGVAPIPSGPQWQPVPGSEGSQCCFFGYFCYPC